MPKILIVEDDEVIARGMADHLGAAGFDPVWVAQGAKALARLPQDHLQVYPGELGRLEQRHQPRERRAQLVRDRRGEGGAQLLVLGARHAWSIAAALRLRP